MKRPLALIGLTTMLVLTVCFYAPLMWVKVLFCLAFVGFLLSLIVKKLRQKPEFPAFFAVVMLAVINFNIFNFFAVKPVQDKYHNTEAQVTATLIEEPEINENGNFYTLKTATINNEAISLNLDLYAKKACDCEIGDTLTFGAELAKVTYGADYADKIYLRGFCLTEIKVIKSDTRPLEYYSSELREYIGNALSDSLTKENAALAKAMLLGDRSDLSDETYHTFRRAGLSHIVVVSGLHLSVIVLIYVNTFGRIFKNKYVRFFSIMLFVLGFLIITGFGKSSLRAAFMLLVLQSGILFKRKSDSLNSVGFAALILCLYNPCIVGDLGVLLSFSATFGIVVFGGTLEKFLASRFMPALMCKVKLFNRIVKFIFSLISSTVGACAGVFPVSVLFFGNVSLVQIFSNLAVAPLVYCFMCAAALSLVPLDFFAIFAEFFGNLILNIAGFFASLPFAYVKADYGFVTFWILAVAMVVSTAYLLVRNAKGLHLLCVVMSLLILISGNMGYMLSKQDAITVYVTKTNAGQSIIISNKDENILFLTAKDAYALALTDEVIDSLGNYNFLAFIACEELIPEIDYDEVLMYDNIKESDYTVKLWDKGQLMIFEVEGSVYVYLTYGDTEVLILPHNGDVLHLPEYMQSVDVLVSSSLISNMQKLSFDTLIANGSNFDSAVVIDFYKERQVRKLSVTDTLNFDVVG